MKTANTTMGLLARDTTDYSDTQFYADLRKASKKLDLMIKQALDEDARGETLEFPPGPAADG